MRRGWLALLVVAAVTAAGLVGYLVAPALISPSAAPVERGTKVSQSGAMALTSESYQPAHGYQTACVGTDYAPEIIFSDDDYLAWSAAGTLGSGASFSFTPTLRSCVLGENSAIIVTASGGSGLQLSTIVPVQGDARERGKTISSTNINGSAYLCMFMPMRAFSSSNNDYWTNNLYNYTITLTNTGAATTVAMDGIHENGWIALYYDKCMLSDADRDGFNDSTEDALAYSTRDGYYNTFNGAYPQSEFKCCMYASSVYVPDPFSGDPAAAAFFSVGFYPPDFNNDGRVDQLDIDRLTPYLGQGSGVPLAQLPPDPGNYQGNEQGPLADFFKLWRRFDLDEDGYVNATDLAIVQGLVGKPEPMTSDDIAPTTRTTRLWGSGGTYTATVPRGTGVEIDAYAWDNAALTKVEFYVNGSLTCTQTKPNERPYQFGLFSCPWSVPNRKSATYTIRTKAYDGAHSTASADVIVTAQ